MKTLVETLIALVDILMGSLLVFVMVMVLVFNPPDDPKATEQVKSPGDLIVQIWWPNDNPIDLDLWVLAPGDRPVGYSNKAGKFFNLLRDDLGTTADISGLNEEVAYTRGLPDGEYAFNVHSYSSGGKYPVRAVMSIQVRSTSGTVIEVWKGEYTFASPHIEHTYVRLNIKNGRVVGEPYFVPKALRAGPQ